jgi:hypothetical protein
MNGIDPTLEQRYPPALIARWFSANPRDGEVRVQYRRPNGDVTSYLPSTLHRYYSGVKGWVAVAIEGDSIADEDRVALVDAKE